MTFPEIEPWVPLSDLMSLPRQERIAYVRKNLATPRGNARQRHVTLDEFALAVGAPDRQAPMRWESGTTPRDYADRIAALTPYPAAAFGADGEAELVRETLGSRLRELEETVARADDVLRLERILTAAIRLLATGDVEAALRVLPAEEAQ